MKEITTKEARETARDVLLRAEDMRRRIREEEARADRWSSDDHEGFWTGFCFGMGILALVLSIIHLFESLP